MRRDFEEIDVSKPFCNVQNVGLNRIDNYDKKQYKQRIEDYFFGTHHWKIKNGYFSRKLIPILYFYLVSVNRKSFTSPFSLKVWIFGTPFSST